MPYKIQRPTQCNIRAGISLNDFELAFCQSFVQDLETFIKQIKSIVDFEIKAEGKA